MPRTPPILRLPSRAKHPEPLELEPLLPELGDDPLLLDKLDEFPLETEELLPMLDELLPRLELDDGLPLLDETSEELRLELLRLEPEELLSWLELDDWLPLLDEISEELPLELLLPEEPELLLDGGDPEELLDPDEPLLEDGGGGGGAPLELEDSLEPDPDELDDSDDICSPFQRSVGLKTRFQKCSKQINSMSLFLSAHAIGRVLGLLCC